MELNALGLRILKSFESCRLKAYQDSGGVWTIGWGDTGGVKPGQVITQAEADARLGRRLGEFCRGVSALLPNPVSDDQFSALVVFAYNLGLGKLSASTLLKKVRASDPTASKEFGKWIYDNGKVQAGLVTRRQAEAALFQSDHGTVESLLAARR
jgi:lysozyme